ncbi:ParA family protein, partial [Desulfobacterales bacterium HSG16]|nr:ParA family protein [Desulfobacterales bacterium HSG16]
KIPEAIQTHINKEVSEHLTDELVARPIGKNAVMHTHNTLPNMAQKYKNPMWKLPDYNGLEPKDKSTISGNCDTYKKTEEKYMEFAKDFLERVENLDAR